MISTRDIANAVAAFQAGVGDYENDRVILEACGELNIDAHSASAVSVCSAVRKWLNGNDEE